jgi:class 3 adenylate cyclase
MVEAIATSKAGRTFGLQVRIGIATGQVVADDIVGEGASEEYAVLGDTPNLAARLQSLASPARWSSRRAAGD